MGRASCADRARVGCVVRFAPCGAVATVGESLRWLRLLRNLSVSGSRWNSGRPELRGESLVAGPSCGGMDVAPTSPRGVLSTPSQNNDRNGYPHTPRIRRQIPMSHPAPFARGLLVATLLMACCLATATHGQDPTTQPYVQPSQSGYGPAWSETVGYL